MTTATVETIKQLFHDINRGTDWRTIGDAIGDEHGYLVNQFSMGWARGILRKCWPDQSCGHVMGPLANGPNPSRLSLEWEAASHQRQDHPYHDGELDCNVVRAAMLVLNIQSWAPDDGSLTFWRDDR